MVRIQVIIFFTLCFSHHVFRFQDLNDALIVKLKKFLEEFMVRDGHKQLVAQLLSIITKKVLNGK